MTKEELIKLGIDEETAKKVEKAVGDSVKTELEKYVPKTKFDETDAELKQSKETLKERDKQLETLKNSTGDIEKLKADIAELQASNTQKDETHAAEIKTLKINTAVDTALAAAKAKNGKAVRALLDLEKAELAEDGTVKGLSDQIKKLQGAEDSKFMFDTETKRQIKGATLADSGVEAPDGKVDMSKLPYDELCAYLANNPDVAVE